MADAVTGHAVDGALRFRVVHAVRGRTRIRVESVDHLDDLAGAVRAFLEREPGIQEIRVNRDSQSIVLTYDPDVLNADRLLALTRDSSGDGWLAVVSPGLSRARAALDDALQQAYAAGQAFVRQMSDAWRPRWEAWMPRALRRAA
jgi:hypothetical protein